MFEYPKFYKWYKGFAIYKYFHNGYYEAYIEGVFRKADTLNGIKNLIDNN
jgi:hypothetical protein